MAALMKSTAVEAVNKGHPSSFYSSEKANPVLQAIEQETKMYVSYMKKRAAPGYKTHNDESSSRP